MFKKENKVDIVCKRILEKHSAYRIHYYMEKFGWNDVLELIGQSRVERNQKYKRGYLKDWNNFKKELSNHIIDDILISSSELRKLDRALVEAAKYHGGFETVRNRLKE